LKISNQSNSILTVGQLTSYIKDLFSADNLLNMLRVGGEISNFKHHSSGHMYFTLKDATSSLRCVMFKSSNERLVFRPSDGLNVVLNGRLSVYERDGLYQLYVESMVPDGVGSLFAAFEKLKMRLQAQGLFAQSAKVKIPRFPECIGVVTSPTGAAIKDILATLARRSPQTEVRIVSVAVQGTESSTQIAEAIKFFNTLSDVDVLIVGRGGGSIEELWAFNEEVVAQAIFNSRIPVISAVGHETDYTISDFVADVRAATPTAAAELAVPNNLDLQQFIHMTGNRMLTIMQTKIEKYRSYIKRLSSERELKKPIVRIDQQHQVLDSLDTRLVNRMAYLLKDCEANLNYLDGKLHALSPEAVLARGFAICLDRHGSVITNVDNLKNNELIKIQLHKGIVDAQIKKIIFDK